MFDFQFILLIRSRTD